MPFLSAIFVKLSRPAALGVLVVVLGELALDDEILALVDACVTPASDQRGERQKCDYKGTIMTNSPQLM